MTIEELQRVLATGAGVLSGACSAGVIVLINWSLTRSDLSVPWLAVGFVAVVAAETPELVQQLG